MWPPLLERQLGLFQLSLGILGVLILGLLNRLLIQDIHQAGRFLGVLCLFTFSMFLNDAVL